MWIFTSLTHFLTHSLPLPPEGPNWQDAEKSALNLPQVAIGSCGLFFVFIISYVGAGIFAKFNVIFFAMQMFAIFYGAYWVAFGGQRDLQQGLPLPDCVKESALQTGGKWYHAHKDCLLYANMTFQYNSTVTGFKWENLRNNMFPDYDYSADQEACHGNLCSFHNVFAIIFPVSFKNETISQKKSS